MKSRGFGSELVLVVLAYPNLSYKGKMMEPYYAKDGITIYHGDCMNIIPLLGRFDLLLTDPPYGLDAKWGKQKGWSSKNINGHGRLWNGTPGWDKETPQKCVIDAACGAAELSIIWGGNYFELPPTRGVLAWDKIQKHTGSDFELAWSNIDMPAKMFRMSRADANINCRLMPKMHPTEKPIALMSWCLELSGKVMNVIDPFMGSGTTLVASKLAGIRAVGIELEEKYCEIAARRLDQKVFNFNAQ